MAETKPKKEVIMWHFFCDGEKVGSMRDGARCEKERNRLRGLAGIEFKQVVLTSTSGSSDNEI